MKNNNFEEDYRSYKEIEDRYDAAREANDGAGIDKAREDMHELVKSIDAKGDDYESIFESYKDARKRGNEYIDLNNSIWDEQVAPLIERLRNAGIERFTFSSTWSSAVETAWLFTENGCKLEGIEQINGMNQDWKTGEYNKVPAYVFSIQ